MAHPYHTAWMTCTAHIDCKFWIKCVDKKIDNLNGFIRISYTSQTDCTDWMAFKTGKICAVQMVCTAQMYLYSLNGL